MKTEQKKIFVVDDNNANLTACKNILKPHYMIYPAPSAAKMFGLMEHVIPDLILMDVDMPEMNGYEAVGRMKKNEELKNIPVIFLSGRIDPTSELFGLNMGALDYIHKPFVSELLLRRIRTYFTSIEYQKTLEEKNRSIKELLIKTLEISQPIGKITGLLDAALESDNLESVKDSIKEANKTAVDLLSGLSSVLDISASGIE